MLLPAALRAAAQPIKPFTLGDRLPFHSMRAHPLARQHKRTLCFAFSHRSPQTRMFERRAVVAGSPPPAAAAGLLSQQSRNPARGLMPKPNGSAEFRELAGRTREAIKADYGSIVLEDYNQGAKICGQPA